MNIDFAFKALHKLAIFRYDGFEFKAVSDKWLHEAKEEEEECKETSSNQTTTIRERMRWHQQKQHTWCIFWGKVFCGLWSRVTLADVNKIEVSKYECHSVPMRVHNWKCEFTHCTLFSFDWLMVLPLLPPPQKKSGEKF